MTVKRSPSERERDDALSYLPLDAPRVVPVSELLEFKPPAWVIKPFIEYSSRGILYGPSDIGKTFLCLDLALSVATGRQWCDFRTARAPVVYICAEGSRSLGRRVKGWLDLHGLTADDIAGSFHAIGSPVQLMHRAQRETLLEAIQRATTAAPALIIIDTLSWCILGADENDSGAMTQLIEAAAGVQRQIGEAYATTEPAVLFVHHTGKSKKGMRGAYSLTAATDFVFSFERDKGVSKLRTERVKDGPKSEPLLFDMLQVTLMEDEDGQPVTTCVCVPRGYEPAVTATAGAMSLGKNEEAVLAALEAAPSHIVTFAELKRTTGLHAQTLTRALKRVTEEAGRVTSVGGKGYRLVTPVTTSGLRGVSEFPCTSPTRSHSHTPPSLEGGVVSSGVSKGPNPKPIHLGELVRFAALSMNPCDAVEEKDDQAA